MKSEHKTRLKELISSGVFLTKKESLMVTAAGKELDWLFDFRTLFFSAEGLNLAAEVFWDTFEHEYPFQVAGLESAALPIVAAIMMKGHERGTPVSGFFIRKSRNKANRLRMIEGNPSKEKTILVDDLINSGSSFLRQMKVLKEAEVPLFALFAYVRFRDLSYYRFADEAGVQVVSTFTVEDFGKPLVVDKDRSLPSDIFKEIWGVKIENPNYFHVLPKSAPVLDEASVYFGSDSGVFWSLSQKDGSVNWKYTILSPKKADKNIFSSPALYKNRVYFGAYDGNMYALDTKTGRRLWIFMEADWIGSSPVVAEDLNLIFVGLEFGLLFKNGGMVALDAKTGKKKWEVRFPGLTHGSPAYSKELGIVIIGSNDYGVYAFEAKSGKLLWSTFVQGEVKASFTFDPKRGYVCFGSFDQNIYAYEARTGKIVFRHFLDGPVYSTPLIYKSKLYVSSLDKHVYCFNLDTFDHEWKFETKGRVFSSPIEAEGKVYIGSNDGKLYEINPDTGVSSGFFQATERIVNRAVYNKKTKLFFVPTFANELYCLERKIEVQNETLQKNS